MTNKALAPEFDYIAEALVTRSDDWHGEKVSREHFLEALIGSIGHLKQLDRIKKSIFYGKDFIFNYDQTTVTIANLPNEFCRCNSKKAKYLIHAIIGVATEAGELLEALLSAIIGKPFDEVNITEEQGDSFWYHAILANCTHTSFEEIQQINIKKLRARYPDKFNAFDANNRNLDKERKILEGDKINNSAYDPERIVYVQQVGRGTRTVLEKPAFAEGVVETGIMSQRGMDWLYFAEQVLKHVNCYTVPQYGDKGQDQVTDWTAEMCVEQAKKYMNRFGKNSRPGQEKLDLLKAAHYIQLTLEKMEE